MAKGKKKSSVAEVEVVVDRRAKKTDRRGGSEDRRKTSAPVAVERRQGERREKVARRRQIDPTTCERDYSGDEIEFMQAMDAYKRANGRMFPTCSEILEVVRALGYVRIAPSTIALTAADQASPSADVATSDEELSAEGSIA